jgi:hypothetical protein
MPLANYGVLKGKAIGAKREDDQSSLTTKSTFSPGPDTTASPLMPNPSLARQSCCS